MRVGACLNYYRCSVRSDLSVIFGMPVYFYCIIHRFYALFLRNFFFIVRHAIILSIVMTLIIWGRPVKYWFFFFQTEISVFDGHPCNNHLRLFVYYLYNNHIPIVLVVWYILFFIFVCLCFICAIRIIFNQLPSREFYSQHDSHYTWIR